MGISPALRGIIRPLHRLGGVARSRSLFAATPPLILALLDEQIDFGERSAKTSAFKWLKSGQDSI
jgi:hypothetical protein